MMTRKSPDLILRKSPSTLKIQKLELRRQKGNSKLVMDQHPAINKLLPNF